MANTAKYEFTGEIGELTDDNGDVHIIKRIRALRDIDPPQMDGKVHKNDLGGWIESEGNLSQNGECWVDDDAWVINNAVVKDDAYICGNSIVTDNAIISEQAALDGESVVVGGNALICGKANIQDNAYVAGYAIICGNAIIQDDAQVIANVTIKGCVKLKGFAALSNVFTVVIPDGSPLNAEDVMEEHRTVIDGAICFDG